MNSEELKFEFDRADAKTFQLENELKFSIIERNKAFACWRMQTREEGNNESKLDILKRKVDEAEEDYNKLGNGDSYSKNIAYNEWTNAIKEYNEELKKEKKRLYIK